MTLSEKNTEMKKLLIFDLDGVLINSEKSMILSWNSVRREHNLKQTFESYRKYIGLEFQTLLKKLKIKTKLRQIELSYRKNAIQNHNKITCYPNVNIILNKLSKKYYLAIYTSKEKIRTKQILKKFFSNIKFLFVQSPKKNYKSKPNPSLLLDILKKKNIHVNECIYIGDTLIDKKFARNSKIDFIYASYGQYYKKMHHKYCIKEFKDLPEVIKKIIKL